GGEACAIPAVDQHARAVDASGVGRGKELPADSELSPDPAVHRRGALQRREHLMRAMQADGGEGLKARHPAALQLAYLEVVSESQNIAGVHYVAVAAALCTH